MSKPLLEEDINIQMLAAIKALKMNAREYTLSTTLHHHTVCIKDLDMLKLI
jgi:hypothetical protein